MKKERVILSFIALLIGLAVAGGAFYVFQQMQTSDGEVKNDTVVSIPDPTPVDSSHLLSIEKPKNEEVISSQTVSVSGKTLPDTVLVVQTDSGEDVARSSSNGSFQFSIDVDDGVNVFNVTALFADGTQKSELRTITYSEEDF